MAYILEWQSGTDRDPLCLVRYVRVFRRVTTLKTFLRSRVYWRTHPVELRLQQRVRGRAPLAVYTTTNAILLWDDACDPLPPATEPSPWQERLGTMSLRAGLVDRVAAELAAARDADLLTTVQVQTLIGRLRRMLAETATTDLS